MNVGFQVSHIEAYRNGIPLMNNYKFTKYTKRKNGKIYANHASGNLEKRVHFAKEPQLFLIPRLNRTCKRMPVSRVNAAPIDSILLYKRRHHKTKKRKPKKNKRGKSQNIQ